MALFKIKYSSLDNIEHKEWEIIEAANEKAALSYAWELACDDLEGYGGLHGTPSPDTIAEEEGLNEEDAWEAYCEERESWLSYEVEPLLAGETEENIKDRKSVV